MTSPVVCGGRFAWGTLQVLLEAKVKGLANGADDVLGQPVRALQDVTCWRGQEKQILMNILHVRYDTLKSELKAWTPTSSVNGVLCYIGNIICCVLKKDTLQLL